MSRSHGGADGWFRGWLGAYLAVVVAGCGGDVREGGPGTGAFGGASGGAAGVGGTVGGAAGAGGTASGNGGSASCSPTTSLVCSAALCGNGKRDTCAVLGGGIGGGGGGSGCYTMTEHCDGADVGSETCPTLGYGSGTLGCSQCYFDTSTCSFCLPDQSLVRCQRAGFAGFVLDAAIAATDNEIGVAWIEYTNLERKLGFARLSPDLDVIASSRFGDPPLTSGSFSISAAPLASGWVIAGYGNLELFVHAVDASGADAGRISVATTVDESVVGPVLVPRPTGGPLLVWQQSGVLRAALVAGDGRSIGVVQDVYGQDPSTPPFWFATATYSRDSFFLGVGMVNDQDPDTFDLRLVPVAPDGTRGPTIPALTGIDFDSPILVAGAADLRVIFDGALPGSSARGSYLQNVDATGATSPPARLISGDYQTPVSAVAFGGDTVALLGTSDTATNAWLAVTRVGPDGAIVTAPHKILTGPRASWTAKGFVARRQDIIAAPLTDPYGDFTIARLMP